jgi:hypothetical protein
MICVDLASLGEETRCAVCRGVLPTKFCGLHLSGVTFFDCDGTRALDAFLVLLFSSRLAVYAAALGITEGSISLMAAK